MHSAGFLLILHRRKGIMSTFYKKTWGDNIIWSMNYVYSINTVRVFI